MSDSDLVIVPGAGLHWRGQVLRKMLFAGAASGDTLTYAGHGWSNGVKVTVSTPTDKTLPGGLAEGDKCYVVGAATDTLQLAQSAGGAAINLTSDGDCYLTGPYGLAGSTVEFRFVNQVGVTVATFNAAPEVNPLIPSTRGEFDVILTDDDLADVVADGVGVTAQVWVTRPDGVPFRPYSAQVPVE